MGREKGGSSRNKSRPSSSSFAAAQVRAAPVGFGGYVGSSLVDSTFSGERETSQDLDGEAALHLKRLSKRDPTTKLKALVALRAIFKEHSVDELSAILPSWVFEYKRLVQDNNRQVRENVHGAMADLTTNAGKGLLPHLRSLMGAWWVSQFDPSREIAEAAQRSFQVTFPDRKKRVDALIYCFKGIMTHLDENLKLTPQALIELGTLPEEVPEKLERILSCSLLALAALLDVLVGSTSSLWKEGAVESISAASAAAGTGEPVKEAATSLFFKHKFFQSFVKNKSSQVRLASYQTLLTYLQHIPEVFTDEENLDNFVKLVLGALGEKVTSCHQSMWDMILLFSKNIPQAWGCSSIRKAVLPKFWEFLRHGCFGSQQISYPYILPFLALLSPQFLAPPQDFFLEFFGSLWQGVYVPALSIADRLSLFKTFQECFVWVVKNSKRYAEATSDKLLQDFLVKEVLLKIVWCQYADLSCQIFAESSQDQDFASAVVKFPTSKSVLPRQICDEVAATIISILIPLSQEGVLHAFWSGFQSSCVGVLLDTSSGNESRLARLGTFFSVLDVKIPNKEESSNTWVLLDVVQPFVGKGFSAIKSSGHPEALRLFGKLISSYGTFAFAMKEQILGDSIRRRFLQEVVPWCLSGDENRPIEPKIELLLSFFEVKEFHSYWKPTIDCVTAWLRPGDKQSELNENDLFQVEVLATLVEKFSDRWVRLVKPGGNASEDGSDPHAFEPWRLPKLDIVGLVVASSNNLIHPSCVRLLRNFLSPVIPKQSLLSPDAIVQLLEKLSTYLLEVLDLHDMPWTRAAPSLILSGPQLLSTMFCLYWAFLKPLLRETSEDKLEGSDDERGEEDAYPSVDGGEENTLNQDLTSTQNQIERSRYSFLKCLQNVRRICSPTIYQKLGTECRGCVRRILTEIVRSSLVSEEPSDVVLTSSLCASWVREIVEYFCIGEDEIQATISCTLAPNLFWPNWVAVPPPNDNSFPLVKPSQKTTLIEEEVHQRFCAYTDTLAKYLSPSRVYAGCDSMTSNEVYRVWLVIELLCSWEWPGGSASSHLLEFLCDISRHSTVEKIPLLLDICFRSLLAGSSFTSSGPIDHEGPVESDLIPDIGSPTRALLTLLRALLNGEAAWRRGIAEKFFFEYVAKSSNVTDSADADALKVLPFVLSILMPVMRDSDLGVFDVENFQSLKRIVCDWLNKALSFPPLVDFEKGSTELIGKHWLEVAVACFPLQMPGVSSGIAAAASAKVSLQETSLLLRLLRRQFLVARDAEAKLLSSDTTDVMLELVPELTLAKLVAASVAYCWQDFSVEEWALIMKCLRKWVDSAVIEYEEMTEVVVNFHKGGQEGDLSLQQLSERKILIELATTALSILILLKDINKLETVTALRALGTLRLSNWVAVEDHMMESVLRILLATGLSEAAALEFNAGGDAANTISKHRMAESSLWESLATVALGASSRAREAAARAADLWGVGKGSISALYALLLSPNSSGALQWVAFQFLSTVPIQHLAVTWGGISQNQGEVGEGAEQEAAKGEAALTTAATLRPELVKLLETPARLLLQSSFTSDLRLHYLLGWSLLLMRLHSLSPLSPTRERLLNFVRDSDLSPTLLDCLFQHIALDLTSGTSTSRRRTAPAGAKVSIAATSATRAVSSGTVSFAVENLWPVKEESLVILAGAIYGLLIRVLPACVRIWFTGLRDRSTASAIENFTSSNCSTQLLADEFLQLQASVVPDDTLSIRANRTLREVIAVYKKEEACLDIVIRLPSCYPLRAVEVDCTRRLGISETLLRKWILSMAAFLRNQNGAMLEAIQMWKKNVDREFEGVEECAICYSIIHTTNHSLPRLACKTCKHKFHSACLYKWFSTSHKSTCPLCQTPF
uniref:E3 ubiquitin-protein ligase listerin n=1 Tax=Physcomitrium patens TaxID=3218 RepID=A0A7I4A3R4_PHYPA